MRQLAVFESPEQARTLAAYLVAQRIIAHAEQENSSYSVWVRDEDQMPAAKEALVHFRENPSDARYANAESAASDVRRQQEAEQANRQKNVVEMRGRWKSGPGIKRKCPLTIGLIVVSVLVALGANQVFSEKGPPNALLDALRFISMRTVLNQMHFDRMEGDEAAVDVAALMKSRINNFEDLSRGEIWRAVTPMFVHYGLMHLVFNMWWMYVLGGQIEDQRGWLRYAGLVLLLAAGSCVGQACTDQWQGRYALFGGMSGVGYGVFGYLWMKVKFDAGSGFQLPKETVFIGMLWLVICILRDFPPFDGWLSGILPDGVANAAHVIGLVLGMAAGYFPLLLKRR